MNKKTERIVTEAARICRDKYGVDETKDSVLEFCSLAEDEELENVTPTELAAEIAEYCGQVNRGYEEPTADYDTDAAARCFSDADPGL